MPTSCSRCSRAVYRLGRCRPHYEAHQRAAGPQGWVDSADTRAHLAALRAAGIGYPRVGELTGIPAATMARIPGQDRVHARTAAAVLAVPVDPLRLAADGAHIDATGSRRRVQALCALGHRRTALGIELGYEGGRLSGLLAGSRRTVTAAVARRVADLYDRLQATPGPDAEHGAAVRAQHGWAPPLAWHDSDIDDPAARPDLGEDRRDFAELVADARSLGRTDDQIARQLGVRVASLKQRLRRAGAA